VTNNSKIGIKKKGASEKENQELDEKAKADSFCN